MGQPKMYRFGPSAVPKFCLRFWALLLLLSIHCHLTSFKIRRTQSVAFQRYEFIWLIRKLLFSILHNLRGLVFSGTKNFQIIIFYGFLLNSMKSFNQKENKSRYFVKQISLTVKMMTSDFREWVKSKFCSPQFSSISHNKISLK